MKDFVTEVEKVFLRFHILLVLQVREVINIIVETNFSNEEIKYILDNLEKLDYNELREIIWKLENKEKEK